MVSKLLKVTNEAGIHARPAAAVVETASAFKSGIWFLKGDIRANAKSIMNIMLLAAEYGSEILVEAEGPDEEEALNAIEKLFVERFRQD
jgi:phosphocarrier protein HPr